MTGFSKNSRWWQGAALYQVYVRSWRDSDGDGYGDLQGVIAGLDYLSWLGVDGIWLSPIMPSPDDDWGYDVSDYLGVHPELGTLSDLDRLVSEARRRDITVLLDLVPNHTSSAHPWFVDASASRDAPCRDIYVWADPARGGGVPNNWLDMTGASAWTFDEGTGQYYLHNFLPSQPDLNWWNPSVHEEFAEIIRFWLDRGITGFRIDVAHGLYKDALLRDNPRASQGASEKDGSLPSVYNVHRPEVHDVYRDWRKIAESYAPPALLLGETWARDAADLASYYGDDDELQLAFNFRFAMAELSAGALRSVVGESIAHLPSGACPVWTVSNHDISRFATRWCKGDERKIRLALCLLLTLPGTTVLYYGDEIGMVDVEVPIERRRDAMTKDRPEGVFCRDFARTPMQWTADLTGGFLPGGVQPWLPLGDCAARSVAGQRDLTGSVLSLVRDLLALRHRTQRGVVGSYEELPSGGDQWIYRSGPLLVAANLSDSRAVVEHCEPVLELSSEAGHVRSVPIGGRLELAPWEAVVTIGAEPAGI